jgi:hypothetical protein
MEIPPPIVSGKSSQIKPNSTKKYFSPDCCSRQRCNPPIQQSINHSPWGEGELTIRRFNGLSAGNNSLPTNKLHTLGNYEAEWRWVRLPLLKNF